MEMDSYDLLSKFALGYVDEMNRARQSDDWAEQGAVRREAQRIVRSMSQVIRAVDLLEGIGLKVS
jgi:hypothetical protein